VLLRLQRSAPLSGARVVAYADPKLSPQNLEFAAIQRLFGSKARVQADAPPPKPQLMESLAGFDVVHLAFHGKYESAEPMRSHLLLRSPTAAPATDEDRLTAAEMFGLPLDGTRLVVLSACESGRAEATHANETLGMSRGLLYAGAQSLLLSQWAVDSEATGAWMQSFYESAQRQTTAEAVRAASLHIKASPGRGHPFYWAAFTLLAR
jgi:CHAT domain-containing protein